MMSELIVSLVLLAMAAAFQPVQVLAVVALMQGPRGTSNGWAFFAGMSLFRLSLAVVFWILLSSVEELIEQGGGRFDIFVGAVLAVLGLLLLVQALRLLVRNEDEDETAASWLARLDDVSPLQATMAGVAFLALDPRDWLIDISAVDLIAAADLNGWSSLLAYLVYIVLAQSLILLPLLMALVNEQKAAENLGRFRLWLNRHELTLTVLTAVVLGAFFLYAGVERLGAGV